MTERADKKKTPIWRRLWPVYLIAAGIALTFAMGWQKYLTTDALLDNAESLDALVRSNLYLVFIGYILVYAAATTFIIPGGILTIMGGFLFGLYIGAPATLVGATLGASILFFASRTSLGSVLRDIAGPFLEPMRKGFNEDALSYMFALRLIPIFPFAVVNIAPGLLGAKYRDYLIATFFGIIPGTIAYTWIGSALKGAILEAAAAGEDLDINKLAGTLASNFIPAFIALGVVALLPVAYKKIFGRKALPVETSQ